MEIEMKKLKKKGNTNDIKIIEIQHFKASTINDDFLKKKIDLKKLASKQNYTGTKLSDILGKWPGNESIEDLLAMWQNNHSPTT